MMFLRRLPASPVTLTKGYGYHSISQISGPLSLSGGEQYRAHRIHNTRHRRHTVGDIHCRGHGWCQPNAIDLSSDTNKSFSTQPSRIVEEEKIFLDELDYNDDEDVRTMEKQKIEASSYQPWKSLLEPPARASWRASDTRRDPPEYLRAAMYRILDDGSRTSKQLKRAHRKVQSVQSDLADLRERERRMMVNGKRHFKQQEQERENDDYAMDNSNRSHGGASSTSSSTSSNTPVNYGYDETLATLKFRLEPNFAITKRVLSECQSLLGGKVSRATASGENEDGHLYSNHWQPKRILDFGIGCGSASAAAIDLFGSVDNEKSQSSSQAIEWIHGIDPSRTMRECSEKLIEGMTKGHQNRSGPTSTSHETTTSRIPPPPPRITFSNSLTPSSDESSSSGDGSFDLALFAYTASDLPDVSSCLAAAAMAFEKLKPNGVFVMIEPGTPDGFNSTRAVRNMLLDCCPPHDPEFEWEDRCHIIAPCTHNGSCPMERHKKNFFSRKRPIGKLGHDLPQEFNDDELDSESDSDDDENNSVEYENEELNVDDQDHVELDFQDGRKMSETDAFNSSFCSFVHSVGGDSRKKGEKFSYLVAQKQRFRSPVVDENGDIIDPSTEGDPFRHDNVTDLLVDALDASSLQADDLAHRTFENARKLSSRYIESENNDLGLELLQGEGKRQSMGRIVRAPIKKKGHVYIDYCSGPGRIIRSRVTKAMSNSVAPGIYAAARKSRWGGLWPDTMDNLISSRYTDGNKKAKK